MSGEPRRVVKLSGWSMRAWGLFYCMLNAVILLSGAAFMLIIFVWGLGDLTVFSLLGVSVLGIIVAYSSNSKMSKRQESEFALGYSTAWFVPPHLDQVEPKSGLVVRAKGDTPLRFSEMLKLSRNARREAPKLKTPRDI